MYFRYDDMFLDAIKSVGPDVSVYLIIRPSEVEAIPTYRIFRPDGVESLQICVFRKDAAAAK